MLRRLIPIAALAIALGATPSSGHAQASVSLSFQMGLFDGAGMGLAASHWGHRSIFSPGFHAGVGASFGVGFGLGLSYVRLMVEAHGGEVRLRGRRGGGTAVEIRLPAAARREERADR